MIVPGFPGSTARLLTAAQIRYHRDVGNPLQMQVWTSRSGALKLTRLSATEKQRQASQTIRSLENSIKRLIGQQAGLENPRIFKKKEDEEAALRKAVASKPEWQRAYGDAWAQIEKAYAALPAMSKRIAFSNLTSLRLGTIASTFVRYAEEIRKPNDKRYEEFRDNRLEALKRNLLSPAPIYPEMEEAILAAWLEEAQKTLGADDPFISAALGGSTPAEVAKRVIGGTKLQDVAFRKALFEGGADAINKSDDPLITLARKVEPIIRELRAWNEEKILSVEDRRRRKDRQSALRGLRQDGLSGRQLQSANRTTALSQVTRKTPRSCLTRRRFTVCTTALVSFNEKPPFDLPPRWRNANTTLNLSTPLNFVYSADTIGGNSGSPVINRNAEISRHQFRQQYSEAAQSLSVHRRKRRSARHRCERRRGHRSSSEALRRERSGRGNKREVNIH